MSALHVIDALVAFATRQARPVAGMTEARDAVAKLIKAAGKAQDTNSGDFVLGRPDVSHLPEAERAAFLRGWDAASEAVYRTGLREALRDCGAL